jgi:hypothetical protein
MPPRKRLPTGGLAPPRRAGRPHSTLVAERVGRFAMARQSPTALCSPSQSLHPATLR